MPFFFVSSIKEFSCLLPFCYYFCTLCVRLFFLILQLFFFPAASYGSPLVYVIYSIKKKMFTPASNEFNFFLLHHIYDNAFFSFDSTNWIIYFLIYVSVVFYVYFYSVLFCFSFILLILLFLLHLFSFFVQF